MKKVKIKYIVDIITLISFLITAITGLAMKFFMLSGVRQGRFQEFLGIQKDVWSQWHDIFGIIMTIAVIAHIIFYWDVFVCMTKNFFKVSNSENCEIKKGDE